MATARLFGGVIQRAKEALLVSKGGLWGAEYG